MSLKREQTAKLVMALNLLYKTKKVGKYIACKKIKMQKAIKPGYLFLIVLLNILTFLLQ